MENIIYKTEGTCSKEVRISHENGVIISCVVIGGCSGNLQGISKLLVGMRVEDVISRLEGIKCPGSRNKATSCPDQIAKALKSHIS